MPPGRISLGIAEHARDLTDAVLTMKYLFALYPECVCPKGRRQRTRPRSGGSASRPCRRQKRDVVT